MSFAPYGIVLVMFLIFHIANYMHRKKDDVPSNQKSHSLNQIKQPSMFLLVTVFWLILMQSSTLSQNQANLVESSRLRQLGSTASEHSEFQAAH